MFNSGILDTVIGVIVIFLQLSLVCTAVNEFVALLLKKRAKELEKGILKLLTSPQLVDKFYTHPLIKGLRPDDRKPSYIPSRTFALALMDIVRRHSPDGAVVAAKQAVTDKEKEVSSAKAALEVAKRALQDAEKIQVTADTVAASTKAAQGAADQVAAAATAKNNAETKLAAATAAKTEADNNLTKVTADANAAKAAETAAQQAETAARAEPKNKEKQKTAAEARQTANAAADKLAVTASSLLGGARDQVAAVQSDLVPAELKTALLALIDNAGANLNKAQANVEQWFDDAMDRVSGVYKRKSQVFIVVIAVVVTVLANVDTLQVANNLSHDKAVRDSLVAAAPELAKKQPSPTPIPTPTPTPPPANTAGAGTNQTTGASGAGNTTGAASESAGNPSASTTPEPSITSIKGSLNELNKLGLPIGYIRVCTRLEEAVVDSCVTETNAVAAKAKLDTAQANADKAQTAFTTAESNVKKAEENLKNSDDAGKATRQTELAKAQADLNTAKATRDSAATELTNAQNAHSKSAARVQEIEQLKKELQAAEEAAKTDSTNESKQQAAREARRKVAFTVQCPSCRKASELTDDELKRRLPTTHDYEITANFRSAVGALLGDAWNLLYSHWLGWLITALATSLGAPFWFDTLNRVMVIRSTIKPHEKSREQESKDNPDEDDDKKKKKT